MSQRPQTGTVLQLGIALALLVLTVFMPIVWWPTPTEPTAISPPAPRDPFELARRDDSEVIAEPLPQVTDGWDELQILASEPIQVDYLEAITSRVGPRQEEQPVPIPTLPTWEGDSTKALASRLASRRSLPEDEPRLAARPPLNTVTPTAPGPALSIPKHEVVVPATTRDWPAPRQLLARLDQLEECLGDTELEIESRQWSEQVRLQLQAIATAADADSAQSALGRLEELLDSAKHLTLSLTGEQRRNLIVARYALQRRLPAWKLSDALGDPAIQVATVNPELLEPVELRAALQQTEAWLQDRGASPQWRQFFLLSELRDAADSTDATQRSQIAQKLAARVAGLHDPTQQSFVRDLAPQRLLVAVKRWAAELAWDGTLLRQLEAAEEGDLEAARQVACLSQSLQWSVDPRQRQLGAHLSQHYRNANIRVSMREEFLNRWIDDPPPSYQPYRDSIMGANVRGRNRVETRLGVDLVPCNHACRILMQAAGIVRTNAQTEKGPAVVYSDGIAHYLAEKDILVTRDGVESSQARAATELRTRMRGFDTRFDGVPVLGGLTRSIVRHQHDQQAPRANAIAEQRSSQRISLEVDREVARQLEQAERRLEESILTPLRRFGLQADAMNLLSTDDTAVARGRLASGEQLAAFTPRPTPPVDSLANVQVHQSAVNNLLDGLRLNGRRTTIGEVAVEIARKFGAKDWTPEELPPRTQQTIVSFADTQPVSIEAGDDVVKVRLRLTELDAGGNDFWYDFDVTAVYEPVVHGARLELVRTTPLSIESEEQLSFRDVLALRGIFAMVFTRERPLTVIDQDTANRPAMQDLAITQCVLSNGWMGIALQKAAATAARPAQTAAQTYEASFTARPDALHERTMEKFTAARPAQRAPYNRDGDLSSTSRLNQAVYLHP
ncbi:MAG: hypothetical protein KDB14_28545 [Planctomycetales bacterium]|nr:hypothetical protein [Planctomycetales bacterium]